MKYGYMTEFLFDLKDKESLISEEVNNSTIYKNDEGYDELSSIIKEGDTVVIYQLQDLASDWPVFVKRFNDLTNRNINIEILSTPNMVIKSKMELDPLLMLEITKAGYDLNNFYLNQKKIKGMKEAEKKGVVFGRRKVERPENFVEYYTKWKAKELPIKDAAAAVGMSISTFFRHCRDYSNEID